MEIIKVKKVAKKPKVTKTKKKVTKEPTNNKKFLITIIIIGAFIILCSLIYRIESNKKYQGYWCNYVEHSSIVVQLKDGHTEAQDENLLKYIENLENVISTNYYDKEGYFEELGENADINDAYVITFSSLDNIGDYIEEIKKIDGVLTADQNTAKTDISLYNIKSFGKYTYTDSDEAEEKDLETGKYKIKKGVITFAPDSKDGQDKMLYIKDDHLCEDPDCTKIFAASNESCGTD